MNFSLPGFPVLHHLPKLAQLMSVELVMPSNHLILCCPLLLPSIFPSIRVFSNVLEALHIRWPKYWSFSFSSSTSNEYSRLISFRIDWFDLLAVQGTTRVFSSTTFWKHQFFSAHPSLWSSSHICTRLLERPYPWLYRPLSTKWCLCFFNTLSRVVIAFLPRSNHLLISWLQSPRSDLGAQEEKICHCFHLSPFYLLIC